SRPCRASKGRRFIGRICRGIPNVSSRLAGRFAVCLCNSPRIGDGAAGGWECCVAGAGRRGPGHGAVRLVGAMPAPGRGVVHDVVVLSVRGEAGLAGAGRLGERGGVVVVAFAGGAVAAGLGAERVAGGEGFAAQEAGVVAGGGGCEDGTVGGVGEESSPG